MRLFVGIDLGTTNTKCSVLSLCNDGSLSFNHLPIQQLINSPTEEDCFGVENTLPSAVWLTGDNHAYTGKYCTSNVDVLLSLEGSFFIRSIKREMSNDLWQLDNNGIVYRPKTIASLILKSIFVSIESPNDVEAVVITIPASFSSKMRRETIDAAIMAGFDQNRILLLDEPVAALFSKWAHQERCFKNIPCGEPILIFDMGGGTLDVTVLENLEYENTIRILSTSRYNEVAGDDLDLEIAALILNKIKNEGSLNGFLGGADTIECRRNALILLQIAEGVKQRINDQIPKDLNGGLKAAIQYSKGKNFTILLDTKKYFPDFAALEIVLETHEVLSALDKFILRDQETICPANIFVPIRQALKRANIDECTIKHVYVVGGSSKFNPIICELFHFFHKLSSDLDPDFAVSEGAAKYCYLKNNENWSISEVTHEKIFLRRCGEPFLEVLQDKLAIPCEPVEPSFELEGNNTYEINQDIKVFHLELFQGISPTDVHMSLVHMESHFLSPPLKAGSYISRIRGWIDTNKIYHFEIWFKKPTGQEIEMSVDFSMTTGLDKADKCSTTLSGIVLNGKRLV